MAKEIVWTQEIVPNGGIDETRSATQIADNAWTAALNVEPLRDGVRTRNGTSKSNTIALQSIDLSHEDGTDERQFTDATDEYIAQSFLVGGSALSVLRVGVRLKISAGSPSGNVAAALYADTAGDPGAVVTGADFTDFSEVTDTDITSEFKWHFFTLATAVSLTAATTYHLVIRHANAAAATDFFSVEEVTTPSGYAGGNVTFSTDAASWTTVAAADLNFRIYSGSGAITGIHDYWLSDGSTQRHVVIHDGEAYKNEAGTMTAISNRQRTAYTVSANTFPSFAVANDRLEIAHGTDTPQKFYVLNSVEYWENQGIAPPTAAPTVAVVAGGSLAVDTYEIDYQYWNNDLAMPSNFLNQGIGAATATTAGANLTIRLSNLPTAVVRDGDRATHLRFYLRSSTETIFTFAGTGANQGQFALDGVTTTHDITSRATAIQAEYDHVVPPNHTINLVAENRMFLAGDPTFPWRVWFSYINGTTAHYESIPTTHFRDFGKGDGDYVTCLRFIPPNYVLVGMKNAIWLMDARRPLTSDRIQIAKGIGISGQNAAVVIGRTVYFVSDGDKSKGMFAWPFSGEPLPVLGLDDTFKALNQGRIRYASCAHYAPGDNRFQWWTLLSSSVATSPDTVLVYDYTLQSWTKWSINANVLGQAELNSATKIFAGGSDGFERQADSGTQDDTTDIASSLTLKGFDFGSQKILKRMRFFDYVALAKTAGSINAKLVYDFGARPSSSATLSHLGTGTTWIWGTSVWGGGDVWGTATTDIVGRTAIRGFGKVVQPMLNAPKPFHLKSMSLAAQPTGRRG